MGKETHGRSPTPPPSPLAQVPANTGSPYFNNAIPARNPRYGMWSEADYESSEMRSSESESVPVSWAEMESESGFAFVGHDSAPLSLYDRHTTTSRYIFDHKDCGHKDDGGTRSKYFNQA